MAATMTLADPEWTYGELAASWAESDDTGPYARACADTEVAWLINHTHEYMPGWSYSDDGSFSGPPLDGAHQAILDLFVASSDYVLSVLGEIAEDYANA